MKKMIIIISSIIGIIIVVFFALSFVVGKDIKNYYFPNKNLESSNIKVEISYYEDYMYGQGEYKEISKEEALKRKEGKKRFAVMFSSDAVGDAVTTIRIDPNGTSTVWQQYSLPGKNNHTPEYTDLTLGYMYDSKKGESIGSMSVYFKGDKGYYDSFIVGKTSISKWKDLEELVTPFVRSKMNDDLDR